MTIQVMRLLPALAKLARFAPSQLNQSLLLEVTREVLPGLEPVLPPKRSGFEYEAYLYVALYQDLTQLSFRKFCPALNKAWVKAGYLFQESHVQLFANGKHRRAIPGQPDMSRFLAALGAADISEQFSNALLLGVFLYAQKLGLIRDDLTLIADYVLEPCQKDKADPYCFGSKEGKTHHKTLAFSIISGDVHLVIANYKIRKKQPIRPLYDAVITCLRQHHVDIRYGLFDRGFYRRELLAALKGWGITVIMPARNCKDSRRKIHLWLQDKSGRTGHLFLKVKYVRKHGWQVLRAGVVLCSKRGHQLLDTKKQFKDGKITQDKAAKQVFPIVVIRGNARGVRVLRGNENHIRQLYRARWAIEIAFRQTHLLGIASWAQGRGARLILFTWKCIAYNLWQIARAQFAAKNPTADPLTLDEFCGRMWDNRSKGLEACVA
jgi:hypothetical protein